MSLIKNIEKTPVQSKKFLAYFLSNVLTKGLLFYMVSKAADPSTVIACIVSSAFIDIGYILGQAALDKYVRIARIENQIKED